MTDKQILIIYTGGTIGMQKTESGYLPITGFRSVIEEKLHPPVGSELPEYDLLELEPIIDSANLVPEHWNNIAAVVIDNYEKYDGFIVLHGTDTMAYSASMLSFLFSGSDKPVIFTGSQIPLIEPRSDAQENLCNALMIAAYHPVPEVTIFFHGKLLRGNRSTKSKATGLDAFESPNYPWLGQAGPQIEIHRDLVWPEQPKHFSNPEFSKHSVAILQIYPGLDCGLVNSMLENSKLDGLIIQSYGVGNLPDQNQQLMDSLRSAAKSGCIILNISQCLQAEVFHGHYACSAELNEIGIISGANMTTEAAYTKLLFLLACGLTREDIQIRLGESLVGEVDH